MRIDTTASYTYPSQRTHTISAAQTKSQNTEQPDFTNMTRQEMRDWINNQLSSGKITVDESSAFVAMTIKVSALDGRVIPAENDFSRQNFIQIAKDGLQSSISRNDEAASKWLVSALSIMSKYHA